MKNIVLSVITISYKDPDGLKSTLESLAPLLSSPLEWEHVVIDSSAELNDPPLSELSQQWPLVRVKTKAEGIYAAFNRGIEVARGQVFWFLNGGDRLHSLETLMKALELFKTNASIDIVYADSALYREQNYLYTQGLRSSFLWRILGHNRVCHQALLYRREVFKRVGVFSTRYHLVSDYEHHFRCYQAKVKVSSLPKTLVEYDMGGNSSNNAKVLAEFELVHRNVKALLPKQINLINWVWLKLERLRIIVIKGLARSPFSSFLRPLWLAWNRRK
ncbi:MAG: glycosyltransferase [Bdellovibrionota bacterium]